MEREYEILARGEGPEPEHCKKSREKYSINISQIDLKTTTTTTTTKEKL